MIALLVFFIVLALVASRRSQRHADALRQVSIELDRANIAGARLMAERFLAAAKVAVQREIMARVGRERDKLAADLGTAAMELDLLRGPHCSSCGNPVDPDCCWCGDDHGPQHDRGGDGGHGFVPMGCDCGRDPRDLDWRKLAGSLRQRLRSTERDLAAARGALDTGNEAFRVFREQNNADLRAAVADRDAHAERAAELAKRVTEIETLVNTPRIDDFFEAVRLEAAHQVERWGTEHDAGKDHAAWHSLVATLLAKATLAYWAKDWSKRTHRLISSAAALLNWHRSITGDSTEMRPGVAADHEVAP